jgi:fatty-acyl-CoA synthase
LPSGTTTIRMLPTPTDNGDLAFRRADFATLTEALDYAARGQTGLNFWSARGKLIERLPFRDLRERALGFGRRVAGLGLARASRIVLVADTWSGFAEAFFGAQYAGLLPVPVAVPAGLGGKDAFIEQLRRQIEASGARLALAPEEMGGFLAEAAQGMDLAVCGTMETYAALPESPAPLQPLVDGEGCYIQFSSGSTRFPLGIDIRQHTLMANIRGNSIYGLGVEATDRAVSWLPLYHDMGLIGFLLVPMCNQRSVDLLSPRDFARRPLQWLKLISDNRCTATYSPSFGYDLVSRRAQAQPAELDLSHWRIAGIGADMIQPAALRRFADTFAAAGFRPSAFLPSYGMAETCVGLAFADRDAGITVDTVERGALAERAEAVPARDPDDHAEARGFVICGRPLPEHRIEVRGEGGTALGERRVGRVFVRGPSVMAGYFGEPEATAAVLSADGWLDTGDLGYLVGGQVVITGRAKDLIIINGRNIWPQDIEWAVEAMPTFRRGDAAAFALDGEDGPEHVVVLAIARESDEERRRTLARDVHGVVREAAGIDALVRLVSPAVGLPTTSSGKLSRSRAKTDYLAGVYGPPGEALRGGVPGGAP